MKKYVLGNGSFEEEDLIEFEFEDNFNNDVVLTANDDLAIYIIGNSSQVINYIRYEISSMNDVPLWQFSYLLNKYNDAVKEIARVIDWANPDTLIGLTIYNDDNTLLINVIEIKED